MYNNWCESSTQHTFQFRLHCLTHKTAKLGLCAFSGFLCRTLFFGWILVNFGFGFEHLDSPIAVEVHWFGFGCLGCLGRLRGDSRGRGKTLSTGAGLESVDIFDLSTPHFRGIGTGGSYLEVDFLNPPIDEEERSKLVTFVSYFTLFRFIN